MPKRRGRPPHPDILTPAEWRTVNLVRHGLTNQQIADRCRISLDAVKYHVANAIAKLDVANRKSLKKWAGVPADSHSASREDSMHEETTYINIGQIARTVSDTARAERWYRDVLGLDHLFTFGDLAFFDCGGTRLMLSQSEDKPGDESIVYFRVPDIHAAHARLANAGIEFINAPHMIHKHDDGAEEWMAFFDDPDGRPLAIMATALPSDDQSPIDPDRSADA